MSDFDFADPGEGTAGDRFKNTDHIDHILCFVYPTETELGSGKNKYTAALCDFVICVSCHRAWEDTPVSGAAVYPRLLSAEGGQVLCRFTLGEAREEGRNPPVLPEPLAPAEREQVQQVFDKYAAKMPSGKVMFDADTFNSDGPPKDEPFG